MRRSDNPDVEWLTKEFIAESKEGLDRMERCLTTLEARPNDPELLAEIFRTVHTIKGTTSFLGLHRLETLAHAGEGLLSHLRSGRLAITTGLITLLLHLTDRLRRIILLIETTGGEGTRATDRDNTLIDALRMQIAESVAANVETSIEIDPQESQPVENMPHPRDGTVRIEVDLLNRMMNLVSELVLTRNQILQAALETPALIPLAQRLDSVTSNLRETAMEARMQPVAILFDKFPRMVRDLAKTCERVVRIEFEGQETRLDKSLLEAIKDPLTHALRNAVDHGIESPGNRIRLGKPVAGLIRLRAYQKSGSVVIEINDDGSGIAIDKVRAKAVEEGLIASSKAHAMSDSEALQMVFLPGLSTASKVTHVSGRGVGMDVVRSNVERVGGSVELESVAGMGTTLRLRVPLTLAIIPALMVQSSGQVFALPQSVLEELVYFSPTEADHAFDRIGGEEIYRLRERALPVVRLNHMLEPNKASARHTGAFYLAVLVAEEFRFGLMLDDLHSQEEIVVKPLSQVLRDIGLFAGAAVLATGRLALILDAAVIAARAGVKPSISTGDTPAASTAESATQRFVIFHDGHQSLRNPAHTAIPLELIERIETVPLTQIRHAFGTRQIDYRGEALELEDESGLVERAHRPGGCAPSSITALICKTPDSPDRRFAFAVQCVLDIANGSLLASGINDGRRLAMVDSQRLPIPERFACALPWSSSQRVPAVAV